MPVDLQGNSGHNPWVGIAVTAALMFDIVSEGCSSPQTAEINIEAREDTLMKWVYLSMALGGAFVFVGVVTSPKGRRWEPALGGGLAMIAVWAQYSHARRSGLRNMAAGQTQGTEQYG